MPTTTQIIQSTEPNHQSDNFSSTDKTSSTTTNNALNSKHIKECCVKRSLNRDWILAGCKSIDIKEATEALHYQAKSAGILIEGANILGRISLGRISQILPLSNQIAFGESFLTLDFSEFGLFQVGSAK